jgi:2-methylcitrate dehydratase PrpD
MPSSPAARVTGALTTHIANARINRLSPDAIAAAKKFILDSLGVALSGTRVPATATLLALARTWGAGGEARVWGTGERLPAASAAFVNSYQIHNQEWDCVHEPAVVHPMAVVLATLLAAGEADAANKRMTGADLLLGCSIAVDVATAIGSAVSNRLRFFRPAMCSALGATAALAAIHGFDEPHTQSALGICYSQLSGTMQAHVEGSAVLPMQIGFNTRAALNAVWLADRGVVGPLEFLTGAFGYFALIDPSWAPEELLRRLATPQVTELSHKPFPSGRATHGGIDGVLTLQRQHGFAADAVAEVRIYAPPLVIQLVDRPPSTDMAPSYARLCLPYVAATALLTGGVSVEDFDVATIARADRHALARRVRVLRDTNESLSALSPQRVEIDLTSGEQCSHDLPAVLGSPARPLSHEQHLQKFRRAVASARTPLSETQVEVLLRTVDQLEELTDVTQLVDSLVQPNANR